CATVGHLACPEVAMPHSGLRLVAIILGSVLAFFVGTDAQAGIDSMGISCRWLHGATRDASCGPRHSPFRPRSFRPQQSSRSGGIWLVRPGVLALCL